jgi:hypothetical protein
MIKSLKEKIREKIFLIKDSFSIKHSFENLFIN